MKSMFDSNLSNKKRLTRIEKAITRMTSRLHKTVVGIISPQPISTCVSGEDVRGDILKGLLFKGSLGKCIIVFNEKPRAMICVEIKTLSKLGGATKTIYTNVSMSTHDIDIELEDGSMVVVSVHSMDDKYKIKEIWISALWTPNISNTKVKQHLIDKLEEIQDEGV